MQNNIINKISPTVRIIISLILIFTLVVSKSIFLNLFLSILILIIIILSNIKIKDYLINFKIFIPWIIYSILLYIIIYRNVPMTFMFSYKILLIVLLIETFIISVNYDDLNTGIYTIIYPLHVLGFNINNISESVSLYTYYIKYFNESSNIIKKSYELDNKVKYSVKDYIIPRLIISNKNIIDLKTSLRVNFYESKKDKLDIKSIVILILFVILFILVIFKEVVK